MIRSLVTRFASGLRYPTLFKLVGLLFVVDFLRARPGAVRG